MASRPTILSSQRRRRARGRSGPWMCISLRSRSRAIAIAGLVVVATWFAFISVRALRQPMLITSRAAARQRTLKLEQSSSVSAGAHGIPAAHLYLGGSATTAGLGEEESRLHSAMAGYAAQRGSDDANRGGSAGPEIAARLEKQAKVPPIGSAVQDQLTGFKAQDRFTHQAMVEGGGGSIAGKATLDRLVGMQQAVPTGSVGVATEEANADVDVDAEAEADAVANAGVDVGMEVGADTSVDNAGRAFVSTRAASSALLVSNARSLRKRLDQVVEAPGSSTHPKRFDRLAVTRASALRDVRHLTPHTTCYGTVVSPVPCRPSRLVLSAHLSSPSHSSNQFHPTPPHPTIQSHPTRLTRPNSSKP